MNLKQPTMTERHKELAINALQKEVDALVQQQQAMEPGYTEKRLFYEDIKQEFEHLDAQMQYLSRLILENQDAINVQRGLVMKPDEEILIVSSKKKGCVRRINWMHEIVELLKQENQPLLFEEIWKLLISNKRILEAYKGAVHPISNSKMAVLKNITNHLNNPRQEHYKQLFLYQRKFFGLPEWFNEQGGLRSIEHARNFNHKPVKKIAI